MKKLTLFFGLALIFITTCIIFVCLTIVETDEQLGLLCIYSAAGYLASYLCVKIYIDNLKDKKDIG
jgi:hypothetical protein